MDCPKCATQIAKLKSDISRLRQNKSIGEVQKELRVALQANADVARLNADYLDDATELRENLADVVEWMDSDIVKQTLSQAATLQLSHPHLGVPVPKEFSDWAEHVWLRARAAVETK